MPYAGGKQWTRPAGHVNVKANDPVKKSPNTGDKAVPCLKDSGCDYTLDVTGGWYDAGDHGKYVVNGGISAWTMLNQYERALAKGTAGDFGDGKLNIPEKKNKVPDILDEARGEMDFMLKMQVPDGKPKAGMVHHKIHDKEWTALGMWPDQDAQPRFLWPPSTAATLNLAATAAQCARIWPKLDKKFADRCLAAAEKAWAAAVANPAVYAGTAAIGGGPYDDKDVSDEFYWAAAELYVDDQEGRVQGVRREVAALQEGHDAGRRRSDPDVDDLGRGRRARDDHAGDGAERPRPRRRSTTARPRSRRPPTATSRWSISRATACRSSPARRASRGARTRSCSTTRSSWRWRPTSRATRST